MATVRPKNLRRTYHPSKTFDDNLEAFAQLAKTENWSFSGIETAAIAQDAIDQRNERTAHDAAEGQFDKLHEAFGLAQQARHARFSAALNAARGAFRNDKAVIAQLEHFRRRVSHPSKPATAKVKTG